MAKHLRGLKFPDSIGVDKPGSDSDRPRREVMMANGFDPEM